MKHRPFIIHAPVSPVWIPEEVHQDTLRQSCVFDMVRSAAHIVRSGASGA
jgi:hypothetical protein